jgi:hypothetical protein
MSRHVVVAFVFGLWNNIRRRSRIVCVTVEWTLIVGPDVGCVAGRTE